jgi:methyltransferase-like protein/trans-aconitate methyltransferase
MASAAGAASSYDEVLYPAGVHPQTHPNRLATVGFLRGIRAAPIDRCRVLELGCGVGSNLIGMAFHFPESKFVGVDQARHPIASGQNFLTELGLKNISLHCLDVSDVRTEQFGSFDFIIAHGLYSWVPRPVRERILEICRKMLNRQGIAYISYNAYPGNHLRDLVRAMMRFHTACFEDPKEKVGQARGLLKFLAESKPKRDYYVDAIRAQFDRTVKYADEAFFHDDLSEVNQPFYFYEFMADAERHGLKFVGEASANDLDPDQFNTEVMTKMKELEGAHEVVREQYKDFIRGCAFRQTLLCHQEIALAPDLLIERIPEVHAMCDAVATDEGAGESQSVTVFRRPGGAEITTAHPPIRAALKFVCSQWPCSVSFGQLLEVARSAGAEESIVSSDDSPAATLANALARAYRAGFLHLNIFPFKVANRVSQHPMTSQLVRFQLERGDSATNQVHVSLKFPDPVSRRLVSLLDGTRDQQMLVCELIEFVESGKGQVYQNGALLEDPNEVRVILERRVSAGLESLMREGMLVA